MRYCFMLLTGMGILLLSSCGSRQRLPPQTPDQRIESSLMGQWNCYDVMSRNGRSNGIPYNLLTNNEQGFELREAQVYMPRYFDGQSNTYTTNYNVSALWGVQEEKYIYFTRSLETGEEPDFRWEIVRLSEQELWLLDHEGRTVKLRKQGI